MSLNVYGGKHYAGSYGSPRQGTRSHSVAFRGCCAFAVPQQSMLCPMMAHHQFAKAMHAAHSARSEAWLRRHATSDDHQLLGDMQEVVQIMSTQAGLA